MPLNSVTTAHPDDFAALQAKPREPLRARLKRARLNADPAFFATGARLTYFDGDYRELHVALPLTWRTRNAMGAIFGGSMFAALEPLYQKMLAARLGVNYAVADKCGAIRFRRPGRTTLYARFRLDDGLLFAIRSAADTHGLTEHVFTTDLVDDRGVVHATVEKTIVISRLQR